MNSKTKFGLTIAALVFVVLMLTIAFVAISVYGVSKINNFSFAFKASKINGYVQADYYFAGKVTQMTTNGDKQGETILNYNGETQGSTKQLKLIDNDSIVLSKTNDFVVFKYCFANTNESKPFELYVTYQDSQKNDKNITVLWTFSENEELLEFPPQNPHTNETDEPDDTLYALDFFADPISGLEIKPGKTYVYIKTQVTNSLFEAEFSGDFTFKMIG